MATGTSPRSKRTKQKRIEKAFKASDLNSDGTLNFVEFFQLLKKGNPDFLEREAETLFFAADEDCSGLVDFREFLSYIFDNKGDGTIKRYMERTDTMVDDDSLKAKQILLSKPLALRSAASTAAKTSGKDWTKMSWQERLAEVDALENSGSAQEPEPVSTTPIASRKKARKPTRPVSESVQAESNSPKATASKAEAESTPSKAKAPKMEDDENTPGLASTVLHPGTSPVLQRHQRRTYAETGDIADMTQEQIVRHSLSDEDVSFAGYDPDVKELRRFLQTAPEPFDVVDIEKYIAKGTAGWVFAATDKESGIKVALKMIRMSQARTGIKEWYVSKLLTEVGIEKAVLTYEPVRVIGKLEAPPVIKEQLANAGPVPYYMCLMQEFMPHGTLEGLANSGKLRPDVMLMALEDLATTLAEMHAAQIQHKDVKPENVMMEMQDGEYVAAKICDFGSAEVGNSPAGRADDIRRFGVTLFSVATGEEWTKRRLIREQHENLCDRLEEHLRRSDSLTIRSLPAAVKRELPNVLKRILGGGLQMKQVAEEINGLRRQLG